MGELSRIGVALDSDLLAEFDALIETRRYTNRSEAFRDLIRAELLQKSLETPASRVVGTITLVYDHHVRLLQEKLTELQHQHHHSILSTLHIHLDHDHCLEVVVVSGKLAELQALADTLISTKGVKHGQANWTVTSAELKGHGHRH
jgi:CopG family transcriptional regulator, nickel-responsive regulator